MEDDIDITIAGLCSMLKCHLPRNYVFFVSLKRTRSQLTGGIFTSPKESDAAAERLSHNHNKQEDDYAVSYTPLLVLTTYQLTQQ